MNHLDLTFFEVNRNENHSNFLIIFLSTKNGRIHDPNDNNTNKHIFEMTMLNQIFVFNVPRGIYPKIAERIDLLRPDSARKEKSTFMSRAVI